MLYLDYIFVCLFALVCDERYAYITGPYRVRGVSFTKCKCRCLSDFLLSSFPTMWKKWMIPKLSFRPVHKIKNVFHMHLMQRLGVPSTVQSHWVQLGYVSSVYIDNNWIRYVYVMYPNVSKPVACDNIITKLSSSNLCVSFTSHIRHKTIKTMLDVLFVVLPLPWLSRLGTRIGDGMYSNVFICRPVFSGKVWRTLLKN